jgi:hypothetical protein
MLHAMFSLLHFQSRFLMPFGACTESALHLLQHHFTRDSKLSLFSASTLSAPVPGTVENFTSSDVCLITKPILPVALRSHLCEAREPTETNHLGDFTTFFPFQCLSIGSTREPISPPKSRFFLHHRRSSRGE